LKELGNITIHKSSSNLESDITIEDEIFYGDLVEFNPITLNETVLEDVFHRFNTAQREITGNELYNTVYYDEIAGDIYDANTTTSTKTRIRNYELNPGYANLCPEGYIYKPHHRIKIGKFSDIINQGDDIIMAVTTPEYLSGYNGIKFKTPINYHLLPNDLISCMTEDCDIFKFTVTSYTFNEDKNCYICEATLQENDNTEFINQDLSKCKYYKHNLNIPEYACMLTDGSGRHLWKDIQPPSEWIFTDELYNTPFTNGAFYHQQNLIFTVRRQDPFKKYSMTLFKDGEPINNNYEIPATEFDNSNVEFKATNNTSSCF
jgi:hypothetical protein